MVKNSINFKKGFGIVSNSLLQKYSIFLLLLCLLKINLYAQVSDENKNNKFIRSTCLGVTPVATFSKVNINKGENNVQSGTGKGLLFNFHYNFRKNNFTFSTGLSTGISTSRFFITLEKEKYNLPWEYFNTHSEYMGHIGIPLNLSYSFFEKKKIECFIETGISLNSVIHSPNSVGFYIHDSSVGEINVFTAYYKSVYTPKPGLELEIGVKRKLLNLNKIAFSIMCYSSLINQLDVDYTILPDKTDTSNGSIKYYSTFIGINLAYEITTK